MKKIAFSIALTTLALNLYAQKNTVVELSGNWKFRKGDDKTWARQRVNTDKWSDRSLPAWDWEEGYLGYGWYREEIVLPEKETYFFNLGQADDDCEVYFNGKLLHLYVSDRPGNDSADSTNLGNQWKKYRSYYIPSKLVNVNKKNSLAIRVWNTGGAQGGIRYGKLFVSNTVFYNQLPIELHGDWIKTDGSNEWLASFYNTKVAYKGQVWNYGEIKKEGTNINITLLNGTLSEHIVVKSTGEKGKYLLGNNNNSLQLCSLSETDNEAYVKGIAKQPAIADQSGGKAYFSGYIKDYSAASATEGLVELKGFNNNKPYETRIRVRPDGTFSTEIDLVAPNTMSLRLPGIAESVIAYIAPGKKTFLALDPEEFKIRVTSEYYNRERLTLYMGDLVLENKISLYMNWLDGLVDNDKKIWDKFIYTAEQYSNAERTNDRINEVALFIINNQNKYPDTIALKKAKIWSAQTLIASPENHAYNSTFNAILQGLGERLEGLQYLVKALHIAEKENNVEFIRSYKIQIKAYVGDMIKN